MPSSLLAAASTLFLAGAYLSFGEAGRTRARKVFAGMQGEDRVAAALDGAGGMDRLGGLLIEPKPGRRAMVDHVVRGKARLVVVETKNWTGHVAGNERSEQWTQTRNSGEVKVHRNPVLQSRRQAKILSEFSGVPVAPLVVMAGRSVPASGSWPPGVVPLAGLERALPALLDGPHPAGEADQQALEEAWIRLVDLSVESEADGRLERATEEASARYGTREWVGWVAMTIAAGAATWVSGPSLVPPGP